jgi:hypothetical protein
MDSKRSFILKDTDDCIVESPDSGKERIRTNRITKNIRPDIGITVGINPKGIVIVYIRSPNVPLGKAFITRSIQSSLGIGDISWHLGPAYCPGIISEKSQIPLFGD